MGQCRRTSSRNLGVTKPRFSVGVATAVGLAFFRHRAFRLGRECSGLMAVREDVGALFLLACAAHGQNGGARTHQARPSLAGQGVALGRVLLCVLQRLRANRPLGLAGQALAAISLIAKHQPGQELATSQGAAHRARSGAPAGTGARPRQLGAQQHRQRIGLDQTHAARTRPRAVHQNAPGAAIFLRVRGRPWLVLLFVLRRSKRNRPLSLARQAQAAISLIAKSTRTAALPDSAPGWIRRTGFARCWQAAQPTAAAWAPDRQRTARRGVGRQGEPPSRPFPAMCATLHKASAAATGPASPPSTGLGRHGQQHGTASPAAQHRTAQAARQPRAPAGQELATSTPGKGGKSTSETGRKKGGA